MPSERERIDHYRITRKIGQGGMGIVYAAHDERLDRQVAIKMILDAGADATARERFWREARAAASVSHPHVCQLYEIGETEGQLYIVMELLEGQSLDSRLESGPIDVPEALTTSLSILGALDALHERAIVHRDLKPSNVFLTKFGVKLLDFGLARPVINDQSSTTSCQPRRISPCQGRLSERLRIWLQSSSPVNRLMPASTSSPSESCFTR